MSARRQDDPEDQNYTDQRRGGIFASMPLWLKIGMQVGFPAALAIFLLAKDAGYIPSRHLQLEPEILRSIQSHDQTLKELAARHEVLMERLSTGLRIMCQNSAKSQGELNNCSYIR